MASTLGVTGVVTANAGVKVDNITIDGQEIDVSSGDLTLDVAGDITLDADGGDFVFKDGGSGDEANKVIRFSTPSHDTDEENAQILQVECEASKNQITIGGGTSALNSSTAIVFKTAAVDTTSGVSRLEIDSSGNVVINETSVDSDFRVESNNFTHALFVQGSDGNVGIGGASAPSFENGNGLEIRNSSGNGAHLKLTDNASGTGGTQGFDLYMFNSQGYIENYENAPIIFRQNGGESARFDADKKLLLGTTTSGTTDLLQIESPASAGGYGIQIRRNDNNTDQTVGRIMMGNVVDSDLAMIAVKTDGANNSGAIQFKTASSQTTATKMTINNAGSVGIGVADGDVTSDGTAARTYVGIIGTANRGRLNLGSTASNGADAGMLAFTNGSNVLGSIVVDTNSGVQNAGIMYLNSTGVLDIRAAGGVVFNESSVDADFRVESNGNTHMLFVDGGNDKVRVGTSAGSQTDSPFNTRRNGANIEFGHSNNGGQYYGTLGAFGSSGHPYIGLSTDCENSANTFTTRGRAGNVIYNNVNTGDLVFAQTTTTSATGQTPTTRLVLNSSGDAQFYNRIFAGGGTGANTSVNADDIVIGLTDNPTERGITIASTAGGGIRWNDGADAGTLQYVHSTNRFQFYAAGALKASIDSEGLKFNGDTAASTALDDYEEGTWTPAVSHGGTAATMVDLGASGSYTKIGRKVTLQGNAKVSSTNGTGSALITGFPYTVGDTVANTGVEGNGVIGYYASWGDNVNSLVVLAVQSSTTGEIYGNHNASGLNASATQITQAEVNANAEFRFTLTYFTA